LINFLRFCTRIFDMSALTLEVSEAVLEKIQQTAQQKNISLEELLLGDFLEPDEYQQHAQKAIRQMRQGFPLGAFAVKREDLHERS
jgi:flagellar hook-basal body complex protein FliE